MYIYICIYTYVPSKSLEGVPTACPAVGPRPPICGGHHRAEKKCYQICIYIYIYMMVYIYIYIILKELKT